VTLVSQGESVQNPSNLKIRRNAICGGFSPSRGDYTPIKLKYGMEEFTHTPNLALINKRGWVKELQNLKNSAKVAVFSPHKITFCRREKQPNNTRNFSWTVMDEIRKL